MILQEKAARVIAQPFTTGVSRCACSRGAAPLLSWVAAAIGAVGHKAGNNQPLNLLRAFVNLKNLCVPHQLFDGVFAVVAVAAKYLQKTKRV